MAVDARIVLGIIASLAIINNGLLLLVICKNKALLKIPYNKLVLSLAITDFITGWYIEEFFCSYFPQMSSTSVLAYFVGLLSPQISTRYHLLLSFLIFDGEYLETSAYLPTVKPMT